MGTDETEYLVLGSGAAGMTMSLLLAMTGKRVVLLERSTILGGSMQRFRRDGIPFDTGFHFSAGTHDCMTDLFALLGMQNELELHQVRMNVFFPETGHRYELPPDGGHRAVCDELCRRFPGQEQIVRAYFDAERKIFEETPLFRLRDAVSLLEMSPVNKFDTVSVAAFLDGIGATGELRAVLANFATCHGTPLEKMSFSNHARVSYGLMDHMARMRGGGESFIRAFQRRAKDLGITIRTDCTIRECRDLQDRRCRHVILSDGSSLRFEHAVCAIHPREILALFPKEARSETFSARVNAFGETCGFFSVFCSLDAPAPGFREELTSCFSSDDVDSIIRGSEKGHATGLMLSEEQASDGSTKQCVTAFRDVFPDETASWEHTRTGNRGPKYDEYKRRKTAEILHGVFQAYPAFEGHLRVHETASMLTFRDYLSPFGSAYGIHQAMGQSNVFGRLPLRNFYAIGQSAMLPGVMGAMLSAVILFRKLLGEEAYLSLLQTSFGRIPCTP